VKKSAILRDGALKPVRRSAIRRGSTEALYSSMKATPYRTNRMLALLSKMFSLAIEWEWRSDNSVRGIPRFDEQPRTIQLGAVAAIVIAKHALRPAYQIDVADPAPAKLNLRART
jgi:hypothetical protein